jgi:hypothetical protein
VPVVRVVRLKEKRREKKKKKRKKEKQKKKPLGEPPGVNIL